MDKIMVRDRQFSVSIPEEKIKKRVAQVAAQISDDLKDQHPLFLAVLNGSFVFAADLMRGITTPCEISFVRMASYEGTSSTGAVKQLIGPRYAEISRGSQSFTTGHHCIYRRYGQ